MISLLLTLFLFLVLVHFFFFFFSSRRRHTRFKCDWSSDVCSSDLRRQKGKVSGAGRLLPGILVFQEVVDRLLKLFLFAVGLGEGEVGKFLQRFDIGDRKSVV